MHAASIEKSERLGRVLDLLSQGGEYSTFGGEAALRHPTTAPVGRADGR